MKQITKRLLVLVSILVFWQYVYAQNAVLICSDNDGLAYANTENSIEVLSLKYNCKKLILITDNGTTAANQACGFTWIPKQTGSGTVKLVSIIDNDSIVLATRKYQVIPLKFTMVLPTSNEGNILRDSLFKIHQPFLVPQYSGHISGVVPKLLAYSVIVMRGDTLVFSCKNKGSGFSEELKAGLKLVKPSDRLIFYNIRCLYLGAVSNEILIAPFECVVI